MDIFYKNLICYHSYQFYYKDYLSWSFIKRLSLLKVSANYQLMFQYFKNL